MRKKRMEGMEMRRSALWLAVLLGATLQLADADQTTQLGTSAAERLAARDLRDPDSARFRDVRVYLTETGAQVVCGEINGKNAYGAYVGYRGFIVAGENVIREGDATYSVLRGAMCSRPVE